MANKYLVLVENDSIAVHQLNMRKKWTIGRRTAEESTDLTFSDPNISRNHGILLTYDERWLYADNHSKNGTWLNGRRLSAAGQSRLKPVLLHEGDVLVFGKYYKGKEKTCAFAVYSEKDMVQNYKDDRMYWESILKEQFA